MTVRVSRVLWFALGFAIICIGAAASVAAGVATWQTAVVDTTDCWFPSLALDSNGRPHISYGALGELKYARYDGATWQTSFVEVQPGATGWYSSIALDALDNPHISYYSPYSSTLMYAHFYSNTWHFEPVGSAFNNGGRTSLALDTGDRPHIVYWDATALAVRYAYHNGTGWQIDTVKNMVGTGQSVSLALVLDGADRPHLCYYDYDAGTVSYGTDSGLGWQFNTIEDVFYNGQNCAIRLDSLDRPHISYRDLGLQYAFYNGSSWQITTVDDDFFAGDGSSLALDSQGRPHISYTDWVDTNRYDLRYAFARDGQWWVEVADTAAGTERFLESSLALDQNDLPHIGYWHQVGNDQLKYVTRDSAAGVYRLYLPLLLR